MSNKKSLVLILISVFLIIVGGTILINALPITTVNDCTITFEDFNGNKHQYIGKGEVWK